MVARQTMIELKYTGEELWARIERAVEKVKARLRLQELLDDPDG